MGRFCVYTAVIGVDAYLPRPRDIGDFDWLCFTNMQKRLGERPPWKYINVDLECGDDYLNRLVSKWIKACPHKFIRDYDESLWIDADSIVVRNPKEAAEEHLKEHDMSLYAHPDGCHLGLRHEVGTCLGVGVGDPVMLKHQLEDYVAEGVDTHSGLWMGGYILRRHNRYRVVEVDEMWWDDLKRYSLRDQISLAAAINRTGLKVKTLEGAWASHFINGPHPVRNCS